MSVQGEALSPGVLAAFKTRLMREPAEFWMLAGLAETFGVKQAALAARRWLQRERRLGHVHFQRQSREWQWAHQPASGGGLAA